MNNDLLDFFKIAQLNYCYNFLSNKTEKESKKWIKSTLKIYNSKNLKYSKKTTSQPVLTPDAELSNLASETSIDDRTPGYYSFLESDGDMNSNQSIEDKFNSDLGWINASKKRIDEIHIETDAIIELVEHRLLVEVFLKKTADNHAHNYKGKLSEDCIKQLRSHREENPSLGINKFFKSAYNRFEICRYTKVEGEKVKISWSKLRNEIRDNNPEIYKGKKT